MSFLEQARLTKSIRKLFHGKSLSCCQKVLTEVTKDLQEQAFAAKEIAFLDTEFLGVDDA